ncbi:abscisic acid responsive elements-binding factor3, partial [Striga asiatica]
QSNQFCSAALSVPNHPSNISFATFSNYEKLGRILPTAPGSSTTRPDPDPSMAEATTRPTPPSISPVNDSGPSLSLKTQNRGTATFPNNQTQPSAGGFLQKDTEEAPAGLFQGRRPGGSAVRDRSAYGEMLIGRKNSVAGFLKNAVGMQEEKGGDMMEKTPTSLGWIATAAVDLLGLTVDNHIC